MAAGKTTAGQRLAQRLKWRFVDLDQVIEELERATVAEIFSRSGQAVFRHSETQALEQTLHNLDGPLVLAVGGGAFARRENQQLLRDAGATIIYLKAEPQELWTRAHAMDATSRPLLRDQKSFHSLLESRVADFQRADVVIVTDGKDVAQTVSEIESTLTSHGVL